MGLALVAVLLMLIGIRRLSAYFLIPHLLMQVRISNRFRIWFS